MQKKKLKKKKDKNLRHGHEEKGKDAHILVLLHCDTQ